MKKEFKLTKETKKKLKLEIRKHFPTERQASIFMDDYFHKMIPNMVYDLPKKKLAKRMYNIFKYCNMLGSLTAHLNGIYKSEINFNFKKPRK